MSAAEKMRDLQLQGALSAVDPFSGGRFVHADAATLDMLHAKVTT